MNCGASIGVMQGRLTPSNGKGIQFFPFDNWVNEFYFAAELGLCEIEWIFDHERYEDNPLWTERGTNHIAELMQETKVRVRSVCFDYFMRRAFYKYKDDSIAVREDNIYVIEHVLSSMNALGASLIEIPIVDDSSLKSEIEQDDLEDFLRQVLDIARRYNIDVGLETDMPPGRFTEYLDRFGGEVYANYDSGNSSGLGYDAREELLALGRYVRNVHIKDRILGNGTVDLGTGSADFDKVFASLKTINYDGTYILQAARGVDGDEKNTIRKYMRFVNKYINKYLLVA